MPSVLILFAHPALEKSRVHSRLIKHAKSISAVTVHDLYELYPNFDIDVEREKALLLQHDIIVWQHPFYWYSAPAIIKQWLDLVLEHGWAYGKEGTHLSGKKALNIISCGAALEAYRPEGRNRYTVPQLLAPFEQTARLCGMEYLEPFIVPGTHKLNEEGIDWQLTQYKLLLQSLAMGEPHLQHNHTSINR